MGELAPPALLVEVANPVCGDILRLSVLWHDGRVSAVAYKTRGCAAAIACGSALTELIQGRSRSQLEDLTRHDVAIAVGGLPPESGHAATLCLEAVRNLVSRLPMK